MAHTPPTRPKAAAPTPHAGKPARATSRDSSATLSCPCVTHPTREPKTEPTRAQLWFARFDAVPIDADRCEMRYVNMVDPNGRLPSSVVAITVPDRAMAVARARLIVADRSQWAQLEAAGP